MAARKNPFAGAIKAAPKEDGLVMVYPTAPIGDNRAPNVAAVDQAVSPERAMELLAFQPPAFTLNADGSPMDEQIAAAERSWTAAWEPSEVSVEEASPESEPEPAVDEPKESEQ